MALTAKVSVQEKIAELESRIAALEKKQPRVRTIAFDKETETAWNGLWKQFDVLMAKVFKR